MVKGQHYVPEFYLKRFAKNGKISVYNLLDGNIFSTDVNKIGKKSYFYDLEPAKLKEMLSEHAEAAKALSTRLTAKKTLEIIKLTQELYESSMLNANQNLTLTRFSSLFYSIK